jgi:Ribbon-helix-helix protein, copG family
MQVTIRADEELIDRIKRTAAAGGRSMNEWANLVFRAATDPDASGSDIERIRERLRNAGLLSEHIPLAGHGPDPGLVREAGRRAAVGTPLSDIVSEDRGS